jgi:hypothetical protein
MKLWHGDNGAGLAADMTALFLDEDQHEIYTGTAEGLVHRWSS